jgi:hypothetical protein
VEAHQNYVQNHADYNELVESSALYYVVTHKSELVNRHLDLRLQRDLGHLLHDEEPVLLLFIKFVKA